jgi:hypothetical protein
MIPVSRKSFEIINILVRKLPSWVATGPAVVSTLDVYVNDHGEFGTYELPDLLLSVY